MRTLRLIPVFLVLLGASASAAPAADPNLWLEDVEGAKAIGWVKERNAGSLKELQGDPRYEPLHQEMRAILNAEDRIPAPAWRGGRIYNFWQDAEHVRGLWRRATLAEYRKKDTKWEILLDFDKLGRDEGESWVYKGANCRAPGYTRCLVSLSRGGKDAVVVREFDAERSTFVAGGFVLPEAKHRFEWLDDGALLVGSDFGPGSLTKSGYPRTIRRWARGTSLSEAPVVFSALETDVSVEPSSYENETGRLVILQVGKTFFETEYHRMTADGTFRRLALPLESEIQDWDGHRLYALLLKDWTVAGATYRNGTMVSIPDDAYDGKALAGKVESVYAPDSRSSLDSAFFLKGTLHLLIRENVVTRLYTAARGAGSSFTRTLVALPDNGTISIAAADPYRPELFVNYTSFLVPSTLSLIPKAGAAPETLKSLPPRFDASGFEAVQLEATSADGTKVPYFLVRRASAPVDGATPTLLYGYGGFQVVYGPFYLETAGKAWLERGGAYALANIRGGGEFGPAWHQAALKKNRPRAFEDFEAVASDLIARRLTSPRRLGIMGGSNGGLLVGAVMTRRPELFRAVVCQVPLLDMMRYHKLLAGHSWMGEYGDPEGEEHDAILSYSPYQNLKKGVAYPRAFFVTSTKDDRVHPGHARKMVARLRELGGDPLYYENIEGGHGGAADLEQRAKRTSLEYSYLYRSLID
ncbi:MAG: prolyl oligopeptidase family serine peptidase [Elusimicrobia bacterium]|nr:prolyl oligopeptidase family serine peptidase [Elusimicrobiota bacterium]